jgi:hypothetical protein
VSCLVKDARLIWLYLRDHKVQEGSEGILLYPIRRNLWQSKTYDLELTFVKTCSNFLASHHGSVIVLSEAWH